MNEDLAILVETLKGHVRVNVTMKSVEIYNDYGVKMVLRDLDDETFLTFKKLFVNF